MIKRICCNWISIFLVAAVSGFAQVESLLLSRARSHRAESCASLINEGSHFTVEVGVGTPRQKLQIVADTGSSGVIIKSCKCTTGSLSECFTGGGRSSTFYQPASNGKQSLIHHKFGSGEVFTTPVKDVVEVGKVTATMDRLLLMVEQRLDIDDFEGILGLGLPDHNSKQVTNASFLESRQSFMDAAGVKFFSICFTGADSPGVLRFDPPPAPKMLKQMGLYHWGLAFEGFSVGGKDVPQAVCGKDSMKPGMLTACGAIPDSGSTDIMGPPKLINRLYADICERWPRCKKAVQEGLGGGPSGRAACANATHVKQEVCEEKLDELYATIFKERLNSCGSWLQEGVGLREVPSLFLHFMGKDKAKETLELTSWAYITRTALWGEVSCSPMFGEYTINTSLNGPVWVIGTPLFHEYQVVFGMDPLSIGFSRDTCKSCSKEVARKPPGLANLVASSSVKRGQLSGRDIPRVMDKAPRLPSYDATQPF